MVSNRTTTPDRTRACTAAAALLWATTLGTYASAAAGADNYPERSIRMIVPYVAGGGVDFFARLVARKLSEALRQQVVIDNKPGGGANIGADLAAHSAPDGYTLFVSNIAYAVNPTFMKKMPFDPQKDLTGVSQIATVANGLVVHPSVPVKSEIGRAHV